MSRAAPPTTAIASFPITAIETCLQGELIDAVRAVASLKGLSLPAEPAQVSGQSVPIDSLVVVCILCAIEPIVGFELPESVVRTGGYGSIVEAIGHLIPRIEREWNKKNNGSRP